MHITPGGREKRAWLPSRPRETPGVPWWTVPVSPPRSLREHQARPAWAHVQDSDPQGAVQRCGMVGGVQEHMVGCPRAFREQTLAPVRASGGPGPCGPGRPLPLGAVQPGLSGIGLAAGLLGVPPTWSRLSLEASVGTSEQGHVQAPNRPRPARGSPCGHMASKGVLSFCVCGDHTALR